MCRGPDVWPGRLVTIPDRRAEEQLLPIIIPVYNEVSTVGEVIDRVRGVAPGGSEGAGP